MNNGPKKLFLVAPESTSSNISYLGGRHFIQRNYQHAGSSQIINFNRTLRKTDKQKFRFYNIPTYLILLYCFMAMRIIGTDKSPNFINQHVSDQVVSCNRSERVTKHTHPHFYLCNF